MKLRYRLFLWVAVVFTVAFALSFWWEERATRSSLEKTYQDLVKQLDKLNSENKKAIEDYLADILFRIQAEVDAVLQGVSKYGLVRKGFEPTKDNLKDDNWLQASSLMITNKWIDFIQSINEESLMSEIIIGENDLNNILHFPVGDTFHLIAVGDLKDREKWEGPFVGIPLDIGSFHEEKKADESYFVYFSPQSILNFERVIDPNKSLDLSINLLEPFLKWIEIPDQKFFLKDFIERILKAQNLLQENPSVLPSKEKWDEMIEEKLEKLPYSHARDFECFTFYNHLDHKSYYQEEVEFYVKEYIEHYNKVGLIWGLTTLINSNLFGKTPISEEAPKGMGMVDLKNDCGKGLLSHSVFFNTVEYDVEKALKEMKTLPDDFLTTHLDIITPPNLHHVFFGNTLRLKSDGRTGYLTIGTHGRPVLSSLSRSSHQIAAFVSGGRMIEVVDSNGSEIHEPAWYQIPMEKLLNTDAGIITVDGVELFFLHLVPYKQLDLHFFIFKPKEEEFAFINQMKEGAEDVVEQISLQMRLASVAGLFFVLIFLNNIAKRITRPISHLAEVTQTVAEGKLDDIEIPENTKPKRQDEIYSLYHSFFEMVKGLREKERVRGILNKVVSEEIATEALKGNIKLGGEEKRVTVLFADIRGFSNMTEKMDPKEVIHLINTCMTKVSEKIDFHGGVIDKYVGDEVMALFGAPIDKPESTLSAIKSALDMLEEIKKWNQERKSQGLSEIEMGIGIHTGNVVAGNMGAENRLNYTVLGANVNLASRICSEAKGMQVLISESTLESEGVKNHIDYEKLQSVELKGFTKPIAIYSVTSYRAEGY